MVASLETALTPPRVPPTIPAEDPYVTGVRAAVERKLAKLAPGGPAGPVDVFSVSFGLLQQTSTIGRGISFACALLRAEDWAPVGHVASRQSGRGLVPTGGMLRAGAMRAQLTDGRAFEAFAASTDPGLLGLYLNGAPLGCWRATEMTYQGRFAQPRRRELWALDCRIGVLDTSLLGAGCAVLELDPDGLALIPMRVRSPGIMGGNPWKEMLKSTPFGRNLGQREPNLDTVLAPQATWIEENLDLFFAATLALRTLLLVKPPSSD